MSRIILTMQMSLDGVVSEVEQWMTMSDDIIEDTIEYYHTLDALVFGGKTYPSMAAYWQHAEKSSESALERKFAKQINDIEKIVLSRSDVDLVWKDSRQLPARDDQSLIQTIGELKKTEQGISLWKAVWEPGKLLYKIAFLMISGCLFILWS